jgi:hypothetical protein
MKTLPRVVGIAVFALCLGSSALVAEGGRTKKTCHEPWVHLSWSWWFSCNTTFDTNGSADVGGQADDRLKTRQKKLVWWIEGKHNLSIAFNRFTSETDSTEDGCPGNFFVDGTPATKPCDFLMPSRAGQQKLELMATGTPGHIYKFYIVLMRNDVKPPQIIRTIDPELEMDTDRSSFQLAYVLAALAAFFIAAAAAYKAYKAYKRSRAAR